MGVWPEIGYTVAPGEEPYTHARIGHSGNWHAGTMTASTTDSDYFADGPDTTLTYEKWKPTVLPATLQVKFGAAKTVDYCAIGAHTLGTTGCAISVEYWDGSAWVAVIMSYLQDSNGDLIYTSGGDLIEITGVTAVDDMTIMVFFPEVSTTKMRLVVRSGSDLPKIGVMKFGKILQMPQAIYAGHTPLDLTRITTMRTTQSETGEFLGSTVLRTSQGGGYSWTHLKADWVRSNWRDVQKSVETEPFFIAWRPETFSEAVFCKVSATPTPSNMGIKDYMQVDMEVRGYGYD